MGAKRAQGTGVLGEKHRGGRGGRRWEGSTGVQEEETMAERVDLCSRAGPSPHTRSLASQQATDLRVPPLAVPESSTPMSSSVSSPSSRTPPSSRSPTGS